MFDFNENYNSYLRFDYIPKHGGYFYVTNNLDC
jgi:hypothetical protein